MKKIIIVLCSIFAFYTSNTQSVGVNNTGASPDPSAMLDVQSSTKGMLVPRMNTTMRTGISSPATGLLVFDTQTGSFWYYTGAGWQNLSVGTSLSDADNDTKIEVENTMDEDTIRITSKGHEIALIDDKTFHLGAADGSVFIGKNAGQGDDGTNNNSTAVGFNALQKDTTGWNNTAIGYESLSQSDAGDNNTAIGANAMKATKYGDFNVAVGSSALLNNTAGAGNVALGHQAMYSTTGAQRNVAIGHKSMFSNTNAERTIAIGNRALYSNDGIDGIIAIGDSALYHNSIGAYKPYHSLDNTAIGDKALKENDLGDRNTALGARSLMRNTTGQENIAIGVDALSLNTGGYDNVAIGNSSQFQNNTGYRNISLGHSSLSNNDGNNNIALGYSSLSENISGNSNIGIGTFSMRLNDDGDFNIGIGSSSLYKNVSGTNNVSVGWASLYNSTSDNNIGIGRSAASKTTTGSQNIAIGTHALYNNTTVSGIVAIGDSALHNNGIGATGNDATYNTAVGDKALLKNGQGKLNTALGSQALVNNDNANYNTAIGAAALLNNISGNTNTAVGATSLFNNTSGEDNVAIGYASLNDHMSGDRNTAIGTYSLLNSTIGSKNVALGYYADGNNEQGAKNTIIGYQAGKYNMPHTKYGNIFLGYQAGFNEIGDNKLYIENSNSASPLIYGDFDTDILTINGELGIGSEYTFPLLDGNTNQVLSTDGSGNLNWSDNLGLWSNGPSNIYYNGSVGIGTSTAPSEKLLVSQSTSDDAMKIIHNYTGSNNKKGLDVDITSSGNGGKTGVQVQVVSGNSTSSTGVSTYLLASNPGGSHSAIWGSVSGEAIGVQATALDVEGTALKANGRTQLLGNVSIGTETADHELSVLGNNSNTSGSDGIFIDVQNSNTGGSVMNGIRFRNGTTANTFKGGIYYRDMESYGRGDLMFVNNNNGTSGNADSDDARMIIPHDDNVEIYNVNNTNENILQLFNKGASGTSTSGIFMSTGGNNTIGHLIRHDSTQFKITFQIGSQLFDRLSIDDGGIMRVAGESFIFNPNFNGDSRFTTDELEIRGGSDLAENFDITVTDIVPIPGMVVSIDPNKVGKLMITNEAKDRKVAGILSGANGIETGMYMGQKGSIADGEYPIALTGRVYVFANEEGGRINPGDFLTSAKQTGFACKVDKPNGAEGAIIGKAMSGIDQNGYVLVLVNLQ